MKQETVEEIKNKIKEGTIDGWDDLHKNYEKLGQEYPLEKLKHGLACLIELEGISSQNFTPGFLKEQLNRSVETFEILAENIYKSREKDHKNPFRKMIYNNQAEMDAVVGRLEENSFIKQTREDLQAYKQQVEEIIKKSGL